MSFLCLRSVFPPHHICISSVVIISPVPCYPVSLFCARSCCVHYFPVLSPACSLRIMSACLQSCVVPSHFCPPTGLAVSVQPCSSPPFRLPISVQALLQSFPILFLCWPISRLLPVSGLRLEKSYYAIWAKYSTMGPIIFVWDWFLKTQLCFETLVFFTPR